MTKRRFNPRWVAFARVNGRTPQGQLDHDWGDDGCRGADFMAWIAVNLRRWAAEAGHPRARNRFAPLTTQEHRRFTRWLDKLSPLPLAS